GINVEDYGLEERIRLIHTDLFEGLEGTYDLIVSNPPMWMRNRLSYCLKSICTNRNWHWAAGRTGWMPPGRFF
ncbi:hypothetical protein VVD44_30395, partial [Pseudomonas aeruginosa]